MRHKDGDWNIPEKNLNWEHVTCALLMDVRDELKRLNETLQVLRCPNFHAIPGKLDRIRLNTTKPKKRKPRKIS